MKADPRPGTPSYSRLCAAPVQLGGPRNRRKSRSEGLCSGWLLQGRSGDRGGQQARGPERPAAQVLRTRRGLHQSRLEGKGEKLRETLELAEIVKLTPMRWPRPAPRPWR